MNTKLYVLGAVLGAAPGLPPEAMTPPAAPPQESRPDSRGASRKGRATTRNTGEADVPRHPCELITILQVPCDATKGACEYTYWKCPEAVSPLRS